MDLDPTDATAREVQPGEPDPIGDIAASIGVTDDCSDPRTCAGAEHARSGRDSVTAHPPLAAAGRVGAAVKVQIVNRFTVPGSIDGHDAVGVTFRITGGDRPFRLTVVTVNWGRGYRPGEFRRNVLNVLNRVDELEYVVLLVQELDETDKAPEHRVFRQEMEPGTTLVGWGTREPIAVSPGVRVTRKRKRMTMPQGTDFGGPVGTGPDRYLVSCIAHIHGLKIGLGNQHPHRNLPNAKVQAARRGGEKVTREVVGELVEVCDLVIHGGDMNDTAYPKSHPREKVAHERDLDTIRYVTP